MTHLFSFLIHLFFGRLLEQVTRRDMLLSPGTVLHNRYVIAKVHEQGQDNAVYLAYDKAQDLDIAIKENTYADPAHRQQFKLEATLLSNLRHPGIPRALDYFIEDRVQFLVMDFLKGLNLQQVAQRRRLATQEILDWAAQLCDILTFLHSLRPPVVHGDVEPANIILGQGEQLFLVDFGAAQVYAPGTMTTAGIRTGQGNDPSSDQYALAATLYALFTGAQRGLSRQWLAEAPLPSIRSTRPDLSPYSEEAISRALSLHPGRRYRDMQDFKAALGC